MSSRHTILIAGLISFLVPTSLAAEHPISVIMTVRTSHGIYGDASRNTTLNTGLRYYGRNWNITANVPYTYRSRSGFEDVRGPGNLYLYGFSRLTGNPHSRLQTSILTQLKIPWGVSESRLTSNSWDGGVGIGASIASGHWRVFSDLGYQVLGLTRDSTSISTISLGAGVGRLFARGRTSASLYYKSHTSIYEGFEPPRQITGAGYFRLGNSGFLTLLIGWGLSEGSPAQSYSLGFTHYIQI